MKDKFNREINYLRVSVTDKCNLKCVYCYPDCDFHRNRAMDVASYETIEKVVQEGSHLGITKVRLTGGEPLLRKDLDVLITKISSIKNINTIALTTNGIHLSEKAKILKSSGLTHLNISLDTLDNEKYKYITQGGNINHVLRGIDKALTLNFKKIKINMVMMKNLITNEDAVEIKKYCLERGIELQRINHYNLDDYNNINNNYERPLNCSICNRIRMLADGTLKPCLNSDIEIPLNFDDISESLQTAILSKPESGTHCSNRDMVQIGG